MNYNGTDQARKLAFKHHEAKQLQYACTTHVIIIIAETQKIMSVKVGIIFNLAEGWQLGDGYDGYNALKKECFHNAI